jgi:GrpB-like predicted nucleotidyltransferase (UPF0157 family)
MRSTHRTSARNGEQGASAVKRATQILPYAGSRTGYIDYDPGAVGAAAQAAALIESAVPWLEVEHIGSTAVPDCAGKGIVDLMAIYPAGKLAATRQAIDGIGFQRQKIGHIFPEERPMRVGAIMHRGKRYRLHLHVIGANSPERESLRRFRDALRADPGLRDAYQAKKLAILQSGLREPKDYTHAKGEFIVTVIGPH